LAHPSFTEVRPGREPTGFHSRADRRRSIDGQDISLVEVLVGHPAHLGDIGGMAGIAGVELCNAHVGRITPTGTGASADRFARWFAIWTGGLADTNIELRGYRERRKPDATFCQTVLITSHH